MEKGIKDKEYIPVNLVVGLPVGLVVGLPVGLLVGVPVGRVEGIPVGLPVGCVGFAINRYIGYGPSARSRWLDIGQVRHCSSRSRGP